MPSLQWGVVVGGGGGVVGTTQLLPTFVFEAGQEQRAPFTFLYSPGLSVRKHSSREFAGVSGQVAAVHVRGKQTNRVPFTFAYSFVVHCFVQLSCQLLTLAPVHASKSYDQLSPQSNGSYLQMTIFVQAEPAPFTYRRDPFTTLQRELLPGELHVPYLGEPTHFMWAAGIQRRVASTSQSFWPTAASLGGTALPDSPDTHAVRSRAAGPAA
jgi:hypothetical protein